MWSCIPTMPGISVLPVPSTVAASIGILTVPAGPTSAIIPSRISTVWPGIAGPPVPSMTSTLVIATTGLSTVT